MPSYEITFADGSQQEYDSLEAAKDAILDKWPEAEIGHDGDLESFGSRTLFWRNERESRDDNGARALGSIREIVRSW